MGNVTKEQLAKILDGLDGTRGTTEEQQQIARDNGLLILYCLSDDVSDDILKIEGAIHDEILLSPYTNWEYVLLKKGESFVDEDDDYLLHRAECDMILPLSDEHDNNDEPRLIRVQNHCPTSWCWIKSNMPHATFNTYKGQYPICEGIIIDIAEVAPYIEPDWANSAPKEKDE